MKPARFSSYRALLGRLVAARMSTGLTQRELAERLGKPQSHVSKVESGSRRLDVVEYVNWMRSLELNPLVPIKLLATELEQKSQRNNIAGLSE